MTLEQLRPDSLSGTVNITLAQGEDHLQQSADFECIRRVVSILERRHNRLGIILATVAHIVQVLLDSIQLFENFRIIRNHCRVVDGIRLSEHVRFRRVQGKFYCG